MINISDWFEKRWADVLADLDLLAGRRAENETFHWSLTVRITDTLNNMLLYASLGMVSFRTKVLVICNRILSDGILRSQSRERL